jgi:hypothetical protein
VALDFTLPPELGDLLARVRAHVEEEALPAETDVADPADLLASWDVVERLRDRPRGAARRPRPRLLTRTAFGKELARHQGLQFTLADSAIDPYASRLMVLHTAGKVEHGLPHGQEVARTKTFVSEAFGRIAGRAVPMHGAAGIASSSSRRAASRCARPAGSSE